MRAMSLRAWRVDCGLTSEQVASQIGVNRGTIERWESGKSSPTYPQLIRLCEIYNCTPDDVRFIMPEKSANSGNDGN